MLPQQAVTGEVLVGWADLSSERPLPPLSDDLPQQAGWSPAWRQKGHGFPAAPRRVTEGMLPMLSSGVSVGNWGSGWGHSLDVYPLHLAVTALSKWFISQ